MLVFSHHKIRRRRGGFTLAEVLIGAAVAALAFVSFFTAVAFGVSQARSARENLRATQIIVNHMEGIRLFRWDQLTNTNMLPVTFSEPYDPLAAAGSQGVIYTGTVAVATANLASSPGYATNMYQITVQVQWQSGRILSTRQMSTYYAQNGVQNYIYSNPN